jgi:oxygen-dependent protoporphyrinogen oxidase
MAGSGRVAVVGAGAAGVSAAFWLTRAGAEVTVFEAGDQVGGRVRTVERNGFRFDTGAAVMPSTYADVLRMVDALGIRGEIQLRGAVIGALRDGVVHRIDRRRPWTALSARNIPAKDKLSLWRLGLDLSRAFRSLNYRDLSTAAHLDSQTMHDYCTRYYPDSVRDNLLEPMTRALLLVEPERTSVVDLFAACRSILVAGHTLTHPDGLGFFLQRAAEGLDVRLNTVVEDTVDLGDGVEVRISDEEGTRRERFDAAVLALPAHPALTAHSGFDPAQRKYLENLEYSTSIVVTLGVARAPGGSDPATPDPSSMVLIPRDIEPDLPVIGLGHNLAPGRAPAGAGVLNCFWMTDWSAAHFGDSDEDTVAHTVATVNRLLPGWADGVRASAVTRWRHALVASEVGTYAGLVDFNAHTDRHSRIALAGDYHAQCSVNASVAAGARAAEQISGLLGTA